MVISRDLQIEFAHYNAGINRSRREYEQHPTACADWCIRCVRPVGSNRDCPTCRDALRKRDDRIKQKDPA